VVRGFLAYHAVPNNVPEISAFRYHVIWTWVRSLRRRSQRHRLPWDRMQVHLERYIPKARVLHPWPEARFRVKYSRWEAGRVSSARRDLCGGRSAMTVPTAIGSTLGCQIPDMAFGHSGNAAEGIAPNSHPEDDIGGVSFRSACRCWRRARPHLCRPILTQKEARWRRAGSTQPVQVSRTPAGWTIHAHGRLASEKRQGTKSRAGDRRWRPRNLHMTTSAVARLEANLHAEKAWNPHVNCVISSISSARATAKAADQAATEGRWLGLLHGATIAIKDNIDTAGTKTTIGSPFFKDNVPNADAPVVARIAKAGAVLTHKVTLHEFAFGIRSMSALIGQCKNPWDTTRIPGGSSGGSAVAVATGLCDMALGTDTGGSVRIPAAINGITGLRPTSGRVPNAGCFPVSAAHDTIGPMARSALDCARLSP
jgi:hypothetical protein